MSECRGCKKYYGGSRTHSPPFLWWEVEDYCSEGCYWKYDEKGKKIEKDVVDKIGSLSEDNYRLLHLIAHLLEKKAGASVIKEALGF